MRADQHLSGQAPADGNRIKGDRHGGIIASAIIASAIIASAIKKPLKKYPKSSPKSLRYSIRHQFIPSMRQKLNLFRGSLEHVAP